MYEFCFCNVWAFLASWRIAIALSFVHHSQFWPSTWRLYSTLKIAKRHWYRLWIKKLQTFIATACVVMAYKQQASSSFLMIHASSPPTQRFASTYSSTLDNSAPHTKLRHQPFCLVLQSKLHRYSTPKWRHHSCPQWPRYHLPSGQVQRPHEHPDLDCYTTSTPTFWKLHDA